MGSEKLRFQILGPLRVWRGEDEITLGPAKQRGVLAVLLLEPGRTVSREQIIASLWESPPASAVNLVQTYVKRLRQTLEPDREARAPSLIQLSGNGGYRLDAERDQIDLVRFRRLAEQARATGEGQSLALRDALDLWHGRPVADLARMDLPGTADLERELRATALAYARAALSEGRAAEAIPRLETLAGSAPLDESLQCALLRAYLGAGRLADALLAFEDFRRTLHEELGVGPGPELAELRRSMLAEAAGERWIGPRPVRRFRRAEEVARLVELVPRRRTVTLTGPPGAGKTSLALTVAEELVSRYRDGVAVVTPTGKEDVAAEIASALRIPAEGRTALFKQLRDASMLLVLDGHVRSDEHAGRLLADLSFACPGVHVIVTARGPLGLPGETLWTVSPAAGDAVSGLAAMRASFEALPPDHRLLLSRMAVLGPGFSLDTAELTCAYDPLIRAEVYRLHNDLVDAALILVDRRGGDYRYRLAPLVRRIALAQADEEDLETARQRVEVGKAC